MNNRIKQLAEQAGFVLWQDEEHNPGDVIDWASRYDDALVKYTELVVRECIAKCDDLYSQQYIADHFEVDIQGLNSTKKETIDLEFSDKELLKYMKMAHELDITFNQLVERALKEAILNAPVDLDKLEQE